MNKLSDQDLALIYYKIQRQALSIDEETMAFYISQSRFDPRLAEVVNENIRNCWWNYDPVALNDYLRKLPNNNAILVMIEQITTLSKSTPDTLSDFKKWAQAVCFVINQPLVKKLFYIDFFKEGSRTAQREIDECLPSFEKFNFYAKDVFFNKQNPKRIMSKHDYETRYESNEPF